MVRNSTRHNGTMISRTRTRRYDILVLALLSWNSINTCLLERTAKTKGVQAFQTTFQQSQPLRDTLYHDRNKNFDRSSMCRPFTKMYSSSSDDAGGAAATDEEDPLAALRKKKEAILKKKAAAASGGADAGTAVSSKSGNTNDDGAPKDFSSNLLKQLENVQTNEDAVAKAKAKIEALQKKEEAARQQQQTPPPTNDKEPPSSSSSSSTKEKYESGVREPALAGVPTPPGTQPEQQRTRPQRSTAERVQTEVALPSDENDFHIPYRLGFGTMSWGDTTSGFTTKRKMTKKMTKRGKFNAGDVISAYNACLEGGVTFVDTSESYGKALRDENLSAEHLIAMANEQGLAANNADTTPILGGTFEAPILSPFRFGSSAVVRAIEQSCERMEVSSLDLYQVDVFHPLLYVGGGRSLAKGLATAIDLGLCNYVGVCNFGKLQLKSFTKKLERRGVQLATNQFEFSLTNRDALKNGLIDLCKELSVTPVAHTPLGGGLASGKYTAMDPTGGKVGKAKYDFQTLEPLTPIHEAQERVAGMVRSRLRQAFNEQKDLRLKDYRAKPMQEGNFSQQITTAQVALHYVIAKGAVPIPGINNLKEANELLGCVGWALTSEEVSILDDACEESERSKPTTKKPLLPFMGRRRSNRVDMGF